MVPSEILATYTRYSIDSPQTLTGVSLETFRIMYRIADLIRLRREQVTWGDDTLADIMKATHEIEEALENEKCRLNELIKSESLPLLWAGLTSS